MFDLRKDSLIIKSTYMKKIQKHFPFIDFCLLPLGFLIVCGFNNPGKSYANNNFKNTNHIDTVPENNYNGNNFNSESFNKAMKELDENMANLDVQLKNLNVNIDTQLKESLSKINLEEIEKQTEASLKQIDWNKMQNDINNSVKEAQDQIAKIDFTKMQNDMKALQEKMQSEEFKSQFDSEKLHKQIDDAMSKAKQGMAKAKEKLQELKDFTDALAADGLIDKKKGYTIEWKNGDLYINDKVQPKSVSDKYRKYEDDFKGRIKMEPDGAEHF
jgi:hypothetical protein